MTAATIPLLRDGDLDMDWEDARYEPEVTLLRTSATIRHRIKGAGAVQLQELLRVGLAGWATEVRCPSTLYSDTRLSTLAEQTVDWDPRDVRQPVYILPGMVATDRCTLSDKGLSDAWRGESVTIPAGSWLARSSVYRVEPLAGSLIRIQEDRKLADGRMRVDPDPTSEWLRFNVRVAPDIYRTAKKDRSLHIAALVSACSQLPNCLDESARPQDEALLDEIRARLEAEGVDLWDKSDNYDPAWAATALAPFRPLHGEGHDGDG